MTSWSWLSGMTSKVSGGVRQGPHCGKANDLTQVKHGIPASGNTVGSIGSVRKRAYREDACEIMQRGRGSRQVQRVSSQYERECQSCTRTAHRSVGPRRALLQRSPLGKAVDQDVEHLLCGGVVEHDWWACGGEPPSR